MTKQNNKKNTFVAKHFEFGGQMMNYYKKIANNPRIHVYYMCYNVKNGYTLYYEYIK